MKKLVSFIAVLAITTIGIAQAQLERTVTIDVTGNRTKRIAVDGNYHAITNMTMSEEQSIVITGLQNGQHTLELFRSNQATQVRSYQTTFTLREGYDMTISIGSTGAVSMSEVRTRTNQGGGGSAISTQAFNRIYIATKKKTSSSSRSAYLESQFASNKMFTSKQASQLIQLVNSENMRLKLAKNVYGNITDRTNFNLVSSLLNSNNSKLELNDYIASFPVDDIDEDEDEDGNAYVPMSQEKFDAIYKEVVAETTLDDRKYYLTNFFGKDFNYYTSLQAKQLIQLVNSEGERFNLAKLAYRGVTDRENYGEVVALLNLPSNRSTLRSYIASYDNANTRPAMSATAFSQLYQSIYNQNLSSARYSALNTAFTTVGNYFTATQARQLIQLVNIESYRLSLSKLAYKVMVDRANYTQLNDLFASQTSRNDFNSYVQNYDNYGNNSGVAMTESEFNVIYNNINNSWSSSSRISAANTAFSNSSNYFTTAQVRRVLLLFNSESDRLTLAKLAYDNVVDPASYSQLYDVFTTTERRTELARYVADIQNGGTGTKIAMSDSEFQSIYRDVQLSFGFGAKMSRLSDIFNKETNYFTVQQTRQLIQLVSAESNRLELAKSAYNNVTDPSNFTQLYDIFTSQASKDELNAYISNASVISQ